MNTLMEGMALLLCIALLLRGVIKVFTWCVDWRVSRIEAEYRASRMVEQARAEVRGD